jgi:hypothetical protein
MSLKYQSCQKNLSLNRLNYHLLDHHRRRLYLWLILKKADKE